MSNNITKKSNILLQIILLILAVIFLFPFLCLVSTSFKLPNEVFEFPPTLIPKHAIISNYTTAFTTIPFFRYTFNTFLISAFCVAGQVLVAPLTAYSISLVDWKGKKIIFTVLLATMLIPTQVTIIPVYMVFHKLGLTGSMWPLIIPAFLGYPPLYIFLLRQFFMTIPKSLIQSSKIEGATEFVTYSKIVLPLCKPALVAVTIFTFLYTWTDFLNPLIYLDNTKIYTLSLGLQAFVREHNIDWGPMMAASTLFIVPVLVLFFFAQKQFVEGITLTGMKG